MSKRNIVGEEEIRRVQYGESRYRICRHWHILEDGSQYHFIHVYKNASTLPIHRWTWIVDR